MGNSELQSQHNTAKSVLISHPIFEQAKIVKNTQGKEAVQIGISMKSEKDFLVWQKNYKRIPKISSLLYPQQAKFQNSGRCGSSGFALIQYSRFPYILAEQIQIRKNNNMRYFDESQLWPLLYSLLSCAQIFHIRKLKIGDIRPQNIFMNQEGSIKVASQYSFPYESVNYEKTLIDRELITYLAPEEVRDLQLGKMKDSSQPSAVQPFSIGLTLLDTALLQSSSNFYQPNGIFSVQKLCESLKLLKNLHYSSQIVDIIQKLCEAKQHKRIKPVQILEHLKPYQNEILLKKIFNVQSLPFGNGSKHRQNPQNSVSEISLISIKKNTQNQKQGYKYVNGVVFDHLENSIQFSSLNNSKEVLMKNSKNVNIYEVKESDKLSQLNCPVQTTIYRPPVIINLPPPVYHDYNPQQNNQHA